ncbi:metalloregulator ArsR/SmtB family transcription factor [Chitinimonas sp.]|uniref:metalloregulator ArsR/SmtB family transcription factor n=1 Tax=Chitinimonas sp. TaxID=1934313 RepID=UPI002F91C57A
MHASPSAMNEQQLNSLRAASAAAAGLLKALSNEDRLLLLCQLVEGEKAVSELEAATGIHQPTLSQQLGVLRQERLVSTRREGKFIYYQLASGHAERVLALLYELYCLPERPHAD